MQMKAYYRYWGKARKNPLLKGPGYHLLVYHSLDVAAVGWQLLHPKHNRSKQLAGQLQVDPHWLQKWFVFCLCLHDLGKFARAFQGLVPDLSGQLVTADQRFDYQIRHDTLGFVLWQKVLVDWLGDIFPSEYKSQVAAWLEVVCGHHGQPPNKVQARKGINSFLPEDKDAAHAFIRDLVTNWLPDLTPLATISRGDFRLVSWQLAGLAVLADWLGSDQARFHYKSDIVPLEDYWKEEAVPAAERSLATFDLHRCDVAPFADIRQQFGFITEPTPLQKCAQEVTLGQGPQLFILEDVTGAGKTEAAMVLTHRLMAEGLYVGLPTMATANAMYERLAGSYRSLYQGSCTPSLVLAHGARQFSDAFQQSVALAPQSDDHQYNADETTASVYCNQWLADNRKKALLADVGVGTIDQALLAVLPARHQSLRLLGLAGKVLLVDEVHAFDPYMRRLLTALMEAHAAQGGSAVLLSATLPVHFRCDLVAAYAQGRGEQSISLKQITAYPLITHFSNQRLYETPVDTRDTVIRRVLVKRLDDEAAVLQLISRHVAEGHCVCWIRNTVRDARRAYEQVGEREGVELDKVSLFHSRYAMKDRLAIEKDVCARFGKDSTPAVREGQVLIATQVVEQSLDLDFDVMISDLAPMDLLIQRAGRLQRHIRDAQGNYLGVGKDQRSLPCLYVLSPDPQQVDNKNWLRNVLPGTQAVYANVGELWRTVLTLQSNGGFAMPQDARQLIESVYGEQAPKIPSVLLQATQDAEGEQKAQYAMGEFNRLRMEYGYTRKSAAQSGGWDEDVNIPTRLGADTVRVALALADGESLVPYAQVEDHAWALSQINVPEGEWGEAKNLVPEQWREVIEDMKKALPALRWVEVFPLVGNVRQVYDAAAGWCLQEVNPAEAGKLG